MNEPKQYVQLGEVFFCPQTNEVFDGLLGNLLGYGHVMEVHVKNTTGCFNFELIYFPTKEEFELAKTNKKP